VEKLSQKTVKCVVKKITDVNPGNRVNKFLNRLHPMAGILFIMAIFNIFTGIITNFEHKVIHVIVVVGSVVCGLLWQWQYEKDKKE